MWAWFLEDGQGNLGRIKRVGVASSRWDLGGKMRVLNEMCRQLMASYILLLGEFWLGLEKVHQIVGDQDSNLVVQLEDWDGNAESLQFPVHLGGEDTAYTLQLTEPVASKLGATTLLPGGLSLPFSTWDQDHDLLRHKNCAKNLSGEPHCPLAWCHGFPYAHPLIASISPLIFPMGIGPNERAQREESGHILSCWEPGGIPSTVYHPGHCMVPMSNTERTPRGPKINLLFLGGRVIV